MDNQLLVVYCTCPDRGTAVRIADVLVNERLAACVNIVPGLTSVYRWDGQLQHDTELLLIIKTLRMVYAALASRIRTLHPYEVPEIIALPVEMGAHSYLEWVATNVGESG